MHFEFRISDKTKKAFSLMEIIVVMFIVAMAFTTFYTVAVMGTRYIIESKNRLGAVAFANEKMEIIRNLAYSDVGLQGGSPAGNILEDENVTSNGHLFHVNTDIQYDDDPQDGLFLESTDSIPNDYKIVKIVVSWNDVNGQTQEVSSVSRFVPPGLETNVGGAPLVINVADSSGTGISQASVHIVNNSVSPAINTTIQTDTEGHIMNPSMPASIDGYHFTITKNGYETVGTMDSSASFTPIYPHASVILASLNAYSYIQDQLANLTVRTADYQNNPIGDIEFSIGGGKVIGHDALANDVFSMANATATTGAASGEKEYKDTIPGNYNIVMSANAQYEFIDYDPSSYPTVLVPGSDLTYTLRVADKNIDALSLKIIDSVDSIPIAGASVTLTDGLGADVFAGKTSSLRGVVFYPDSATPLPAGDYDLKVEASGYDAQTIPITIDKLTDVTIDLVKSI